MFGFTDEEIAAKKAALGPIADMPWEPFFLDTNSVFGDIACALDWYQAVDVYMDFNRLSRKEAVDCLAIDAKMAPLEAIPPQYVIAKIPLVPINKPSFGFRREHSAGKFSLLGWAMAHEMDLYKAAGI